MADTAIERHASSPEPTIADGNTEHDTEPAMAAAAVVPATAEAITDTPALSKNQQRRQRREAQRLANKPDRRAKERAMRKEKKAEKRRLVEEEGADPVEIGLQKKRARTESIVPFDATVVIDLSFDDKMSDKVCVMSLSTRNGSINVSKKSGNQVYVHAVGSCLQRQSECMSTRQSHLHTIEWQITRANADAREGSASPLERNHLQVG